MTSSDVSLRPVSPKQRKSWGDRLGSLLGSKAGHISDFHIELDEPLRHHHPGETVKGTVVLDVSRPLGITHLVICLYGYVQVLKANTPTKTRQRGINGRISTGRSRRWVPEYYGDGFVSLFEEEVALCGDGRLDPSPYHFRFEVEFPSNLELPASIEFERGTISYEVMATLTRPGSVNTTTTCERHVYLREVVDVGTFHTPSPRVITIEPPERGNRSKSSLKRLTSQDSKLHSCASANSRAEVQNAASQPATNGDANESRPQTPSITSSASSASNKRHANRLSSLTQSHHSASSVRADTDGSCRPITTTIEVSKAAALPGDVIPVKITIEHTKTLKCLHGVLATLYREARVDMHPNLPLGPTLDGREAKYEDYYPRSKSGLGGLSLSAAGSSQTWRKDLSQTSAPIYINPLTMTTELKLNVRVPPEVFPSIRNVPGEMISFKYYIEIIIDIHGKLAAQDRNFATLRKITTQPSAVSGSEDPSEINVTAWGVNCIDTSRFRRDKDAITYRCDLVIGTKHSEKAHGKQRRNSTAHSSSQGRSSLESRPSRDGAAPALQQGPEITEGTPAAQNGHNYPNGHFEDEFAGHYYYENGYHGEGYDYYNNDQYYGYEHGWPSYGYDPNYAYYGDWTERPPPPPPPHPPIPQGFQNGLSEKERLKRAEEALVPSQPPVEGSVSQAQTASAPIIPDEHNFESPAAFRAAIDHQNHQPSGPYTFDPEATESLRSNTTLEPDITPTQERTVRDGSNDRMGSDNDEGNGDAAGRRTDASGTAHSGVQSHDDNETISRISSAGELPRYER